MSDSIPDGSHVEYDVVVLGGGPAGCATALSLAAEGLTRVLVVESSEYQHPRIGESIPPDTRQLLHALGILDEFLEEPHDRCPGSCSSWGGAELGYNDFMFNPLGNGWHLDRRRFDEFLAETVSRRGLELRRRTKFIDVLAPNADGVRLRLASSSETYDVTARFVVDATGKRSVYARRRGARRRVLDRLVCVAACFQLPDASRIARHTMLEAVEYGWWYMARLPQQRVAVAVATSHALYLRHRFDRRRVWLEALAETQHIAPILWQCEGVPDGFTVCDAPSFLLDRVHGNHWLAVGDAAASYDPISSQGVFKALADGLQGGRAVAAWLQGDDLPLVAHQAQVERQFVQYQRQRAYFYDRERRWQDGPFWEERRRHPALLLQLLS